MNSHQQERRPQNIGSKLLRNEENDQLFNCLSKRAVAQASAVVQVYESHPNPTNWSKRCCGVATFVKDNGMKSFFIRVYDIKARQLMWEHELYNSMKYETPKPWFHTFASDDFWVALSFANDEEAGLFKRVIQDKLHKNAERKSRRKKPANSPKRSSQVIQPPPTSVPVHSSHSSATKKNDKKNKKLTKADISRPSNFLHVGHVGWDPDGNNWQLGEEDELKEWCKKLGIPEENLKDLGTINFIKEFISKHGGIDAIKKEKEETSGRGKRGGPPPPPPSQQRSGPPDTGAPLHPPPTRTVPRGSGPPPSPPFNRGPPPPPPPPINRGQLPPPPHASSPRHPARPHAAAPLPPPKYGALHVSPPPPPPSREGPRPPPPSRKGPPPPRVGPPPPRVGPPPPRVGPPPSQVGHPPPPSREGPPPPPPSSGRNYGGANTDLLSDIQSGTQLKAVDHSESRPDSGGRDALLESIRGGKDLKKMTPVEKEEMSPPGMGGLGSALLNALGQRNTQLHDSDEDDSDEGDFEDDDDDWDE